MVIAMTKLQKGATFAWCLLLGLAGVVIFLKRDDLIPFFALSLTAAAITAQAAYRNKQLNAAANFAIAMFVVPCAIAFPAMAYACVSAGGGASPSLLVLAVITASAFAAAGISCWRFFDLHNRNCESR